MCVRAVQQSQVPSHAFLLSPPHQSQLARSAYNGHLGGIFADELCINMAQHAVSSHRVRVH